jgi:DNA-binding SARP family transcriptional activator
VIRVFGGFEVWVDDARVDLPSGQPTRLVKVLALMRGGAHVDVVTELLWPDEAAGAGRARLRNVLLRVRAMAPDLVGREGERLTLLDGEIDLAMFEDHVRGALTASARDDRCLHAREAVSLYRGELLPADPYATWASDARARSRAQMSSMLDLLVEHAVDVGDVEDAVRWIERAAEVEDRAEERHVQAATLLCDAHPGRAVRHVRRARSIVAELGFPPSDELVALERRLALD